MNALRLVVVLALVALAACSGSKYHAAATSTTTSVTEDANLVPAQHQQCADLGTLVDQYLLTGDTGGRPELDQSYATERASILGQPSAARSGLARADADNEIQACDQRLDGQAAAAAQAAADARVQAAARAQARAEAAAQARSDAADNRRFGATCAQHGGALTQTQPDNVGYDAHGSDPAGDYCGVTYHGMTYQVTISETGVFDTVAANENKGDCDNDASDAQSAAQDGVPWSQLPVWHADTGMCERGSP